MFSITKKRSTIINSSSSPSSPKSQVGKLQKRQPTTEPETDCHADWTLIKPIKSVYHRKRSQTTSAPNHQSNSSISHSHDHPPQIPIQTQLIMRKSSSSLHQIISPMSNHQHHPPLPNHHLHSSTTTFSRPTIISSTTTSQVNHDFHTSPSRPGLRKSRQHPTFNLILVGSKETGKTAFVNNLFGSFGAYAPPDFEDQDKKINKQPTDTFREYAAGHVPGLTGERVVLSVVDTPGLDIQSNDELVVEHKVNEIIHYLEEKFDRSLQLERQVKREPVRLGDTHIHCCLYFLHPSVLEPASRASQSQPPKSKQSTTTTRARLAMMNMDMRAMRRISKRTNVFPVIGRADELTVAQLTEIRNWIRSEMRGQNIDLSVLTGSTESDSASDEPDAVTTASSSSSSSSSSTGASPEFVPQLKQRRSFAITPKKAPLLLNMTRAEQELNTLLPLALVSTEEEAEALGSDAIMTLNRIDPLSGPGPDRSRLMGDHGYVRRFKWATLDLLDPNHCDFVLLRAVLMGTHLARLKDSTLEKYEAYRTEQLIRRERFTKVLTLEEKVKLVKEMQSMEIPKMNSLNIFDNKPFHQVRSREAWQDDHHQDSQMGPIVR